MLAISPPATRLPLKCTTLSIQMPLIDVPHSADNPEDLHTFHRFRYRRNSPDVHFMGVEKVKNCILSEFVASDFAFYRSLLYLCALTKCVMESNEIYKVILDQREELPFLVEDNYVMQGKELNFGDLCGHAMNAPGEIWGQQRRLFVCLLLNVKKIASY